MPGCCNHNQGPVDQSLSPRYRKILWTALIINAGMFAVEILGGLAASSMSLFADALDFFGDAFNYGITLMVLSLGALWRSRAAWVKGATMLAFGIFIILKTGWMAYHGTLPDHITMGIIGALAFLANVFVAALLFAYREGDANMKSIWLCSRNDAIGNLAVILAAFGVFGSGSGWPDLVVAVIMSGLAISAGWSILKLARRELDHHAEEAKPA